MFGRFTNYLFISAMLALCCCSVNAQLKDPGLQQWTDKDGEVIEARLLQYDPSSKSVRFAKDQDNLPYEFQLGDLNLSGKVQALLHPNFFNEAQYSLRSDIGIRSIITLSVWGLILFIAFTIVFLLAYLLSSRIVMGVDPVRFKINGYFKLFFIYVFFCVLSIGLIVGCVLLLKNKPELANSAASLCGTIIAFIAVLISIFHLKKYYDVSLTRSFAMFIVYGLVAALFLSLFVGAIAGLAYYGFHNSPELTDGILSNLLLKPMKLI